MMLWVVCELHILPGTYYRLPDGEKMMLRLLYNSICAKEGSYGA